MKKMNEIIKRSCLSLVIGSRGVVNRKGEKDRGLRNSSIIISVVRHIFC